jgi:shikimate kinase / 3-dehydroquinate synthase
LTWRGRHIYLWGLPGAGKSSIGKELARLLKRSGYGFVDRDEMIVERAGISIAEIFDSMGEDVFRELETQCLTELSQFAFEQKPLVIATGGGTPLREVNRAIMRGSGVTVWIDVTTKQAAKNVIHGLLMGETRPLLRTSSPEELQERMRTLYNERTEYYEQATLHFVTRSQKGDERTQAELAEEMLKAFEQMSKRILLRPRFEVFRVHSALGTYPVSIGSGIAAQELSFAVRDKKNTKIVVVSDENITKEYIPKFFQQVTKEARRELDIIHFYIKAGEGAKNFDTLQEILAGFSRIGVKRKEDVIVSLGGGVVSDITGLAASMYMRGIPLIHIPTSLIGQLDASLGGKTGIDHNNIKNLIGTFYAPKQVIVDPLFLKTLPKRELHAGLAEALKYGLISSPELWTILSKSIRRLLRGFDTGYEVIIRDAVKEKIRFIEWDEFERTSGARELLNFGHSFGHAFEAVNGFSGLLHGEAVALGMRAASYLSMEMGLLPADEWREIEQTLGRLNIPSDVILDTNKVIQVLTNDKKQKRNSFRLVLLRGIGKADLVEDISEAKVREAIEFIAGVV